MRAGLASGRSGGLPRRVEPELLDDLPIDDPRAIRSRQDLRRVNRVMGNGALVLDALDRVLDVSAPVRLTELGAGDGSLMLDLARQRSKRWRKAHVTLIDRLPCASPETLDAIRDRDWTVELVAADVFAWLEQKPSPPPSTIFANLFMHHFAPPALARLMHGVAGQAQAFVCCEPRRSRIALAGSHLIGALGCNAVTRHDAVLSVHAGFRDHELTQAWPTLSQPAPKWQLSETAAGLFSHRFIAARRPS